MLNWIVVFTSWGANDYAFIKLATQTNDENISQLDSKKTTKWKDEEFFFVHIIIHWNEVTITLFDIIHEDSWADSLVRSTLICT